MDREGTEGHIEGIIAEVILGKEREEHIYCPCCNGMLDRQFRQALQYAWSEEEIIADGSHFIHFVHEKCGATIAANYTVEKSCFHVTEIKTIEDMKRDPHQKMSWSARRRKKRRIIPDEGVFP